MCVCHRGQWLHPPNHLKYPLVTLSIFIILINQIVSSSPIDPPKKSIQFTVANDSPHYPSQG